MARRQGFANIGSVECEEVAYLFSVDVDDVEPLPADHALRGFDNAVLTGHTGYVISELYDKAYGQAVENVRAWLDGAPVRLLNGE